MNYNAHHTLLALLGCLALTGCIRDDIDACPKLSVELNIKDRTYANAKEAGYDDPLAQSSQFKDLVPTLYYSLRDADNGNVVRETPITNISHSNPTHTLDFDDEVPFGKYVLTVWGALTGIDEIGNDPTTCDLTALDHQLFVASETIDYNYDFVKVVSDLERGNGLVIVETIWDTFPEGIDASEETFTGLTKEVDSSLQYSGEQQMVLSHRFSTSTQMMTTSVLPPSVGEKATRLKLKFFSSQRPSEDSITPEPISLTVKRNEVTHLKLSYSLYTRQVIIESMVNGRWQVINSMKVD